MSFALRLTLFTVLAGILGSRVSAEEKVAPSHDRPYFLPAAERDRIRAEVQKVEWAKAEYARVKAAAEKGATKTASGLIITTTKPGNGASPKETDKVKVHYTGTLTDGTVFDSSVQRNEPATFQLLLDGKPAMKIVEPLKEQGKPLAEITKALKAPNVIELRA